MADPVLRSECTNYENLIASCLEKDDLKTFQWVMNSQSQQDKKSIVNKINSESKQSPFFIACKNGCTSLVNYMTEQCHADLEQMCEFEIEDANFRDIVTPLWVAIENKHNDVVSFLIASGADINHESKIYHSVPVRVAGHARSWSLINDLISNGADLTHSSIYNINCLYNAVFNGCPPNICDLMCRSGVNINQLTMHWDYRGETSLHQAIKNNRLDLVKILLKHGADPRQNTDLGYDALTMAAYLGKLFIFNWLLCNINIRLLDTISAYEMLGVFFVDSDKGRTRQYWQRANHLRKQCPYLSNSQTRDTFLSDIEPIASEQDLESLPFTQADRWYAHAIIIYRRVFGPCHEATISKMRRLGSQLAEDDWFHVHFRFWKETYLAMSSCREHRYPMFDSFTTDHFAELAETVALMQQKFRIDAIREQVCHRITFLTRCFFEYMS